MEHLTGRGLSFKILELLAMLLLLFAAGLVFGQDLNKGYTFTLNEHNITHTKLNNLVDQAQINTSFYTGKSATTAPASGDFLLLYSAAASGYRKCSLNYLLFANTNLIASQTEKPLPMGGDYLLIQDVAANLLKKSTLDELVFTNDNLINARTNWTTPNQATTFVLAYDSGAYSKLSISNLFWHYGNFSVFTNLATNTAPKPDDTLLVWDSVNQSNRQLRVSSLLLGVTFSNLVLHTAPSTNDALLIWDSINLLSKKVTLSSLMTNAPLAASGFGGDRLLGYSTNTTNIATFRLDQIRPLTWFTNGIPVPNANIVRTFAHGLGAMPQHIRVALVCTNAAGALGYALNDEIDLSGVALAGGDFPPVISTSADIASVFMAYGQSTQNWRVCRKDTGAIANITKVDWNLTFYVARFHNL